MRIGAIFPQLEIGNDPAVIRSYAEAVEELGFDHILVYDHVLGGNRASYPDLPGPYDHSHCFHEPFVLFGFLAAITRHIELTSGIIILPQRQTALVAKQAAEVDVLTGGRLRLGVGIGWNALEYEALGENFSNRGRRSEEQIDVLRQLFAQELVTYEGRWHRITDAGLNPLPVRRQIPIWLGGLSEKVMHRIAQMGDGWFPLFGAGRKGAELMDRFRSILEEHDRDPRQVGIDALVLTGGPPGTTRTQRPLEAWMRDVEWWRNQGASHISLGTMDAGLTNVDAHIETLRRFKEAMASA